jgi:asparagine synthase (glutamine-hydrolysing)
VRHAAGVLGARLHSGDVTSLTSKAKRLAAGLPLTPSSRYARYVSWFDGDQRADLYSADFAAITADSMASNVIAGAWNDASGEHVVDVMLEVDATTYLPGDLITKIDIATMAYALEARSPLLDHELMEFAAGLPAELKIRGREKKWILRQALRGWLPDEILDRPKQGFMVPVGEWFRGSLRNQLSEVLLDPCSLARGYFKPDSVRSMIARHQSGAADESKRLWSLFMLELWHREYVDRTAAPAALVAA